MRCGAVAVKVDKDQHAVAVKKKDFARKNCSVRVGLDLISELLQTEGMRGYAIAICYFQPVRRPRFCVKDEWRRTWSTKHGRGQHWRFEAQHVALVVGFT